MSKDSFRKDLSMPGLLREMRECFDRVPDLIVSRGITLSDCLMTGLAIFCLKIPSMLKYEPKFSSWGKTVLWQVIDVEPITVFNTFKND